MLSIAHSFRTLNNYCPIIVGSSSIQDTGRRKYLSRYHVDRTLFVNKTVSHVSKESFLCHYTLSRTYLFDLDFQPHYKAKLALLLAR